MATDFLCESREHSYGSQQIKSTGDATIVSEDKGTDGQGRHETMSNESYEEFQLGDLKEAVITKMLNQSNAGFNWMSKSSAQADAQSSYSKNNNDGQVAQETQNASTQVNILQGAETTDNKQGHMDGHLKAAGSSQNLHKANQAQGHMPQGHSSSQQNLKKQNSYQTQNQVVLEKLLGTSVSTGNQQSQYCSNPYCPNCNPLLQNSSNNQQNSTGSNQQPSTGANADGTGDAPPQTSGKPATRQHSDQPGDQADQQAAANGIKKKKRQRNRKKKKTKGEEDGNGRAQGGPPDGEWDGTEEWAQRLAACIKESEDAGEVDGSGGGQQDGREGGHCRKRAQDLDAEEEEIEREVQEFRKKMEAIFGIRLEPTTAVPDEA